MYSTVILTRNEEADIQACIDSLGQCDDIHVLDSGSTDRTVHLALAAGAQVIVNPFESFGQQRNWALDNLPIKHEWILFLDADERMTPNFSSNLSICLESATSEFAGFFCCWKLILEDTWLRRSDNFPKWQMRVCRMGRIRFTDFGHGQKEDQAQGKLGYIREPYLHYGFSKGWTHWLDRHNRYATAEAKERLVSQVPFKQIFSRNGSKRNPALKVWLTRLPGWPVLRFVYSYILRMGILEGVPGYIYCKNMAYFEFLIKIKMREMRNK